MIAAEEYVRTSRPVVFKIQRAVNRSLVEGRDLEYFEDQQINRLCAAGRSEPQSHAETSLMNNLSGRNCLGGIFPTLIVEPDLPLLDEFIGEDDTVAERVELISRKETDEQKFEHQYFVTVSRCAGLRRLHMKGCFAKPDRCCETIYLSVVAAEDFDAICKSCKTRMSDDAGREPTDSSSTASSSSTCVEEIDAADELMG